MTAPAPDRRCGTCVFWETTSERWGWCEWSRANMPASLRDVREMHKDHGTDCSQWADGAEAGEGRDE